MTYDYFFETLNNGKEIIVTLFRKENVWPIFTMMLSKNEAKTFIKMLMKNDYNLGLLVQEHTITVIHQPDMVILSIMDNFLGLVLLSVSLLPEQAVDLGTTINMNLLDMGLKPTENQVIADDILPGKWSPERDQEIPEDDGEDKDDWWKGKK